MAALAGCRWKFAVLAALVLLVPIGAWGFTTVFPPGLYYSGGTEPATVNGVFPDSGPTGTTFTFVALYLNPLDPFAPSQARVLIDTDGNGVVGGVVTPFAPPRAPAWLVWSVPGLLLMLLLLVLGVVRRRYPVAIVHTASAILIALVAMSCGGGSSAPAEDGSTGGDPSQPTTHGGMALASCTSPVGEAFAMTPEAGPDYTAAVEFTYTATFDCEPGLLVFRFDFISQDGTPVFLGTAINHQIFQVTP